MSCQHKSHFHILTLSDSRNVQPAPGHRTLDGIESRHWEVETPEREKARMSGDSLPLFTIACFA
ncbi:hypothetical protein, partial [Acinetobacter baumannii]|uniref:hypothetical protein n=1 Tax=Acinetobacter baumannii TaxID=470 RepID=UPI001C07503A